MSQQPINLAIVGLGFGAEFIPIYQRHPGAYLAATCQRTEATLKEVGDNYDITKRYTSYDEFLADPDIDAIHINTLIPNHAEQTIAALEAGKLVYRSHPHLVHQFIKLLQGSGAGYPNAVQSANITCTGILVHESAQQRGTLVRLPEFTHS